MSLPVPVNRKPNQPGVKPPDGVPPQGRPGGLPRPTPYWRKLLLGEWEDE